MMRHWSHCVVAALVGWLVLASPHALATSAVFLTEAEQAELSTAVVLATVTEQVVNEHPQWRRPQTLSTITVDDVLLGQAPDTLTIHQLGGTHNGKTLHVPGDAELEVGETCVLFLSQQDGTWFLTAMEQSRYAVVSSVDGPSLERQLSSDYYVRDARGALVPADELEAPSTTLRDLALLLKELK